MVSGADRHRMPLPAGRRSGLAAALALTVLGTALEGASGALGAADASLDATADAAANATLGVRMATCPEYISCTGCTAADTAMACQWCPVDGRCHARGCLIDPDPCFQAGHGVQDVSSCPAPAPRKTSFSLSTAYHMLRLAEAAYSDDPREGGMPEGFQLEDTFNFSFVPSEQGFGYIATNPAMGQVVFSVRGTVGPAQIIDQILREDMVPWGTLAWSNPLVNYYHRMGLTMLEPQAAPVLVRLITACPSCSLYFTGHSLGGCIAALMALRMEEQYAPGRLSAVYTFGQPRIGNFAFAQYADRLLPRFFRAVNGADVVPHFPGCNLTLAPCSNRSMGYYHAGIELWFPYGEYQGGVMCGYRECTNAPQGEDPACSDGFFFSLGHFPSEKDHHGYGKAANAGFCGKRVSPSTATALQLARPEFII